MTPSANISRQSGAGECQFINISEQSILRPCIEYPSPGILLVAISRQLSLSLLCVVQDPQGQVFVSSLKEVSQRAFVEADKERP
jgi:hypothetical protein